MVIVVLSPNISNDLGGEGSTHGFSDSKKLTRTLVDATVLKRRRVKKYKNYIIVFGQKKNRTKKVYACFPRLLDVDDRQVITTAIIIEIIIIMIIKPIII